MNLSKTISKALAISAIAAPAVFAASAYQNQVGYLTNGQKLLTVLDAVGKDVVFKDKDGSTVLTVKAPEVATWAPAGDDAASLIDFSELKTAGTYQAYIGDEKIGHPIVIGDAALEEATIASLKFFYHQRASMATEEKYAGKWAREAGHPDTVVYYHESTGNDPTKFISAPKGWYDAGDYGKYVVNSGISTYTLLQLYQHNKDYFKKTSLNIPESDNEVPDILDEIRWNLEWMLKMQDEDGGVFHKLTTKQFVGTVFPVKATGRRYVIGKAEEAALNFAAVMALASEIYKPYDEEFAKQCILAAEKAFIWSEDHQGEPYVQPKDIGTGSYTGSRAATTRLWATAELYRVTGDSTLGKKLFKNTIRTANARIPSWQDHYMLAAFTIATNPDIFTENNMADSARILITNSADKFMGALANNGYGVSLETSDFNWGSNGIAANKAMVLVHAYILTKEQKYYDAALTIVDYILGRNPMDISYLTGYGKKQVMYPHHRPSQSFQSLDSTMAPVPGMIAGGPNSTATDCAKAYINKSAVAKSYYDNSCSYATNEVAINWNAPFAYTIGTLQAIASTEKVYDVNEKTAAQYTLAIPFARNEIRRTAPVASKRLIVRGHKVMLEYVDANGIKTYRDMSGKMVR